MDKKNRMIEIKKEDCLLTANELFVQNSGLHREGKKQERIRENAWRVRDLIEGRVAPGAICTYFDQVSLEGKEATIGGRTFFCNAFEQVPSEMVKGAYVYVLTAGDFALEDRPIMDQLLADIWGTAFTDAAREKLEQILSREASLSNGFGPGFYGMDVAQMRDLVELVDASAIGVEVRSSSILVPLKSCAGVYFHVEKGFQKITTECEDCRGTVHSCNFCNVKKLHQNTDDQKILEDEEVKNEEAKNDNRKMFKCTGICSQCGRCKDAGMIAGANKRKTKILTLPEDFRPDTKSQGYGVAFDVGTTTVVGMLVDLYTGAHLHSIAKTNPQNKYGLDVISRITYANEKEENLSRLRSDIVSCLNHIIEELCRDREVSREAVVRVALCGNTTMSHIFAGYSPRSLALAPFAPAYTGTLMKKAEETGLHIAPGGDVMVFPNIAGHVGGDITSGLLAVRFLKEKGTTLFIDIGTNGEIALTDGERTLACSTAAGPAFEGSAIYQGMRAAPGAIEKIQIDHEKVLFQTIESIEPMGICGSGLIDAIAQMLDAGLIKRSGRLLSAEEFEKKHPGTEIANRLRDRDGKREFVLVFKEHGEDIVITQNDIREVQLAKGAISAGITIMLSLLEKTREDIQKVVVAGAFGNFIDKESAVTIGLLPDIPMDKILSAGNTAGAGSLMAVTNAEEAVAAKNIPGQVVHVELASEEDFQEKYVGAMAF